MILSPALHATWPSAIAVAAYLVAIVWSSRAPAPDESQTRGVWAALWAGWLAQAVAIGTDALWLDHGILHGRFGFALALSITTWIVLAVYALESRRMALPTVRRILATLALVSVVLAWLFPGLPQPSAGHALAPLHWLTGFASYGLFGAALLHAGLWWHTERRLRTKSPGSGQIPAGYPRGQALGIPLLRLESLTLRFVVAGFIVLTITLLMGTWVAQPWRWDHKTVFSVLAWLVFATLLIGRARFGWRGRQAVRWLASGYALLLLAYVGSRFVLEIMLNRPAAG